ncbi:MAG: TMAO reductase system periplasmic protein TorT [Gammaproteobacteria bacterium]|nr:TMAO reductase system periplasmic protein TorT [Gammaproteobacteria bacterium]
MTFSKILIALALTLISFSSSATNWFPLQIDVWDPPFNTQMKRHTENYSAVNKAAKPWKICVSIPHLKDAYWLAVNFALVDEAKRLGVRLRLNEAGGYDKLEIQKQQIQECMNTGADGLIVSGITTNGINEQVEQIIAEGKPVVDLINWISAKNLTARTAGSYWDNGYQTGNYLKQITANSSGKKINVIWLPGPKGPGWSLAGDTGFKDALKDSQINILKTSWGDTGRAVQEQLIKEALEQHTNIDYVIGSTVSAEAAVDILTKRGLKKSIKVISYYYGPGVHRGIRRGQIIAAPTDKQGIQARLAINQIIKILEAKPYLKHIGPKVEVVDRKNIKEFDQTTSIPPRGFRPVFSVDDWVTQK